MTVLQTPYSKTRIVSDLRSWHTLGFALHCGFLCVFWLFHLQRRSVDFQIPSAIILLLSQGEDRDMTKYKQNNVGIVLFNTELVVKGAYSSQTSWKISYVISNSAILFLTNATPIDHSGVHMNTIAHWNHDPFEAHLTNTLLYFLSGNENISLSQ